MGLEPSCCKKRQKRPRQETGLENRIYLRVLDDTKLTLNNFKGVTHARLGQIWDHSEPSDGRTRNDVTDSLFYIFFL